MLNHQQIQFKEQLKAHGLILLKARMDAAEFAMQQAQEAANNEEKSSAGDKYETARSMSQLDKAMNARQLEAAKLQFMHLQNIVVDTAFESFVVGSVALINQQYYFLSVGLGNVEIDGQKIIFVSPQAPLCIALFQKKVNDVISFQGKNLKIETIF